MTINERIAALRGLMARYGLQAYIIPGSDPHQSEYLPAHWKLREWISGFTGSAGVVVITPDHAGLWTDSRYFLQAEQQLQGTEVELHRQQVPHAPEHIGWMLAHLPEGGVVGCDGSLFSLGQLRYIEKQLEARKLVVHADLDLLGEIWTDRPSRPTQAVYDFPVAYAGRSRSDKLGHVRALMQAKGARRYLITTLDDIAWLLNLRGSDVECNPVFVSYLVIDTQAAHLFIDEGKIPEALSAILAADGVSIHPYLSVDSFLSALPASEPFLIDPHSINVRLYKELSAKFLLQGANIPQQLKAIKNEEEIGHIRAAMIKDGLALTKLYRWLEGAMAQREVTEYEVARQLDHFRRAQGDYIGESFAAIVGYQANGAIIHYRPDPDKSAVLKAEGLLLLDSGGQYLDGTTDITRTTALGIPSPDQRHHFTLVLKGHIALATARFPRGTVGMQLDALARQPLWAEGLNYGHGTGHGVGFFLSVHESPQGFASSATTSRGATAFEPGMLTSNEPGFYREGAYGIRIENLILCVEDPKKPDGSFLKFETLSLYPLDLSLIDRSLLTLAEQSWINAYHELVFEKLSPLLNPEEVAWLEQKCRPLG